MRVCDVMTREARCIGPDATLRDAACLMRDLDVGSLPVCDHDRLTGVITDRDIAIRCVAEGGDPSGEQVSGAMTPKLVYCFDDQDIVEAAAVMRAKQVRRLPVLNREKRLVGIVSIGDLAVEVGDDEMVGQTLERISEPA